MKTVFECSSTAGIVVAVAAGLGVALLSDRPLRPDIEIIPHGLPTPPALVYVVRRARKSRNPALDNLIAEVDREISRSGRLSLAV